MELSDASEDFINFWFLAAMEQHAKEKLRMIQSAQIMNIEAFGDIPIRKEAEEYNILMEMIYKRDFEFLENNFLRGG